MRMHNVPVKEAAKQDHLLTRAYKLRARAFKFPLSAFRLTWDDLGVWCRVMGVDRTTPLTELDIEIAEDIIFRAEGEGF